MECWSNGVMDEFKTQYSSTPILQYSGLLSLLCLSIQPLYKSTGLDLAQQPAIDEVFRIGAFGSRICLGDLSYSELHILDVRIGNSFECRGINPLRLFEHRPVGSTGIFSNDVHRK